MLFTIYFFLDFPEVIEKLVIVDHPHGETVVPAAVDFDVDAVPLPPEVNGNGEPIDDWNPMDDEPMSDPLLNPDFVCDLCRK
jgi:hypothetical protein